MHYTLQKEAEYLDNSNIRKLGIVKFAEEVLPRFTPQKTPYFHFIFYYLALKLYLPLFRNKLERLLLLIAFRGSSKSTAMNCILILYLMIFNGRKYTLKVKNKKYECLIREAFIVIISETGPMAEDFVVRVRDELQVNEMINYLWPSKIQAAYDAVDKSWTKRAFKYNNCFLLGLGQGMQIRGRIKGASRVSFLIGDDIYSEINTVTDASRTKIRGWWNKAVKNSVDDVVGKIMLLGTIVHSDTVLVDCMHNDLWETYVIKLMPLKKFEYFIKKHMTVDYPAGICRLRYDDEKDKITRIGLQREYYDNIQRSRHWGLAWPERLDLYYIALMFKENFGDRTLAGMYQEYFHEVVFGEHKKFRKEFFQSAGQFRIFTVNDVNWIDWEKYDKPKAVTIQIGIDIGGSAIDADDTVITVAAMLANYRIVVVKQIIGNFSTRDITWDDSGYSDRIAKVITGEGIKSIGWQDELFRQALFYNADMVKIGYSGNEIERVYEVIRLFNENGNYIQVVGRLQSVHEGDKKQRIKRNLESPYQTMMMYHAANLGKLEYTLEYLDGIIRDDTADSLEVAVNGIRKPEDLDYEAVTAIPDYGKEEERLENFQANIVERIGYNPWKQRN